MNCLRQLSFSGAVFGVFFMMDKGFSVADFAIFQSVVRLSQAVLEIPSGIFADRFGRRFSVQLSRILVFVAIGIIAFGATMPAMILAALLDGIANALFSDSDTSLVYDSLKKEGKTGYYPKFIATYNAMGLGVFGAASVLGAFLAAGGMPIQWLLIARLPIFLIHFWVARKFIDKALPNKAPKVNQTLRHLKASWTEVISSKSIMKVIYFNTIIHAMNLIMWVFYQPYGMAINMSLEIFGLVALVFAVAEGFPQFVVYRYTRTRKFSKLYIGLIMATGVLGLGAALLQNHVGFVLLIVSVFVTGISYPFTAAIIHKYARTKYRTTIASFCTLFGMVGFSVAGLVFGEIAGRLDVFWGFGMISGAALIGGIIYILFHWGRPWLYKRGKLLRLQAAEDQEREDDEDSQHKKSHRQWWGGRW